MQLAVAEMVLRVAGGTVGASEIPANSNAGPYVERVLAVVGLAKGQPWCAAHVADVGVNALKAEWPLPKTGGCQVLYEWGAKKGIVTSLPAIGDVFLIWHKELNRFAHTGFVVDVKADGSCVTHEGNTSGAGSREGWIVARRSRRFQTADRFLHWQPLVEAK